MLKKLAIAISVLGLTAGALALGTPAQAQGVKVGVLTCNVSSGFGFIFGSSRSINCSLSPGSLSGTYIGATGSATVGVGVGANVLVGGSGNSISLQPVSFEGSTGLNVAAG